MSTPDPGSGKVAPPLETKAKMDKDYDYYIAKYSSAQAQPPFPASRSHPNNNKYPGHLGVMPMEPVMEQVPMGTPPLPPSPANNRRADPAGTAADEKVDGDDALLDLAQLEELHHEAERMKALGNKHMAAQVRRAESNEWIDCWNWCTSTCPSHFC